MRLKPLMRQETRESTRTPAQPSRVRSGGNGRAQRVVGQVTPRDDARTAAQRRQAGWVAAVCRQQRNTWLTADTTMVCSPEAPVSRLACGRYVALVRGLGGKAGVRT